MGQNNPVVFAERYRIIVDGCVRDTPLYTSEERIGMCADIDSVVCKLSRSKNRAPRPSRASYNCQALSRGLDRIRIKNKDIVVDNNPLYDLVEATFSGPPLLTFIEGWRTTTIARTSGLLNDVLVRPSPSEWDTLGSGQSPTLTNCWPCATRFCLL